MNIDIAAAWIRKSAQDQEGFLAEFAARMRYALPGRVQVEDRKASLFSREKIVTSVSIRLKNFIYIAKMDRGLLKTVVKNEVRGIVISTNEYPLNEWLRMVGADIQDLAVQSSEAVIDINRLGE